MTSSVRIHEVSPRDGLQNEAVVLPTDVKVELIGHLVAAGLRDIEVTSFVRPEWVPQLADAKDVLARLPSVEGVRYWGLVPNRVGLERAMDAGLRHVATFMSASESHNKKNLNRTRKESLQNLVEVLGVASDDKVAVRAYLSTVFGCPYEGDVPVERTLEVALPLYQAGAETLVLGDTVGMGTPLQVRAVIRSVVQAGIPVEHIAIHLHDTRGTALANAYAAWEEGVRTFDGSMGGVGGCPYAPGAAGNAATEDLVQMFHGMGCDTGVNLDAALVTGRYLATQLGRALPSRYLHYAEGVAERAAKRAAAGR